MESQPTIETKRLRLRPFTLADAPTIQKFVDDRELAATTTALPHPYPKGGAEEWISKHQQEFDSGNGVHFAMTLRETDELVGHIDLRINAEHEKAEVGFLVYRHCWGRGYATDALRAVIRFGFESLHLRRIEAHHFENNPASGKVQLKAGMTFEGRLRKNILKWGQPLDTLHYAILREEYDGA